MNTSNQLKAGAILSYVNLAIGTILPFFYTPIMLRILGQAEYGLFSLSNSVISYLSLLTLGVGGAILRFLTRYRTENNKDMLERTAGLFLMLYGIIALVTCVVGYGLTFFTGTLFAKGLTDWEIQRMNVLILIMVASTAVSLLCSVYSSLLVCYERYLFQRITGILGTVLAPCLNLVVLYAGYASIGMALAGLLMQILTLAANIWYCFKKLHIHPKLRNLPFGMLREVFGFSLFVFVSMIADLLYWACDKVLLGAMVGTAAVAVYNIGGTFNSILQTMSSAISGVFAPRVNQYVFSDRKIDDFSALLIRVGRIQYLIVALVLSGFVTFGRSFILLWAGPGYEDAYAVALLTMIPLAIPLIQNIAFTTITAQNRHQFRAVLYVFLAVANAVGTYLLIPSMGVIGAALCTCIVFVLGHGIIMNWFYYHKIGLDIPGFWKNILKMTVIPAIMSVVFSVLHDHGFAVYDIRSFLLQVAVYTAIYCGLSWLFTMNAYEKQLVSDLLRKLLPRRKSAGK